MTPSCTGTHHGDHPIAKRIRTLALALACLLAVLPAASRAAVDRDSAEAFAKELEAKVNTGDSTFFQMHFAFDALLDQSMLGLNADEAFAIEFRKGLKKEFNFPDIVAGNIHAGGHYKFLRLSESSTPLMARFRLTSPEGLNYHDLYLKADDKGSWYIVDVYIWRAGERLNTLFRRNYVPLAAKQLQSNGDMDGLSAAERAYGTNFGTIHEFQQFLREEKFKEALAVFETLPPILKRDKTLCLLRFRAASGMGGEIYRQAISDYRDAFPTDPSVDVVIFDALFLQERYAEALNALNRIDRSVGGDPYLNVQRGGIMLKTGNFAEAQARGAAAAALEPDLLDAWWIQVVANIRLKNYKAAVALLDGMVASAGEPPESLEKSDSYNAFVGSVEYQNWKRKRRDQ